MIIDIVVSIAIAAVLAALLGLALTWRRPGDVPRSDQRLPIVALFGALVAAATWLGGAWLAPHDPGWAPRWLAFLLVGLSASFVLVSLIAAEQRWRSTAGPSAGASGAISLEYRRAHAIAPGLTALFWGLLVGVVALAWLMWVIQPPGW